MLSTGIQSAFAERLSGSRGGARRAHAGRAPRDSSDGTDVFPAVLEVDVEDFSSAIAEEAFGPSIVIVRYDDVSGLLTALRRVPGSLTATLHVEPSDDLDLTDLLPALQSLAGRIVFNGYPTGVRVAWAQHHGGPWPATNSIHTSVGVTAMRRFLRPMAWQDAPGISFRSNCRTVPVDVPRRIDGELVVPAAR